MIRNNRCNRQYSAKLTGWLGRLAHFVIAIQHTAGNNLKFTYFLSSNPVEEAAVKDVYIEQYVINVLTEQAKLNIKHGSPFANEQHNATVTNETTEMKSHNQSKRNRTIENN